MDNVTHAIAGLLVAEVAIVLRRRYPAGLPPARRFRLAACSIGVIGNNLPDLDFVYTSITPGKLGYLLHHRGHTHTIVAALAFALLLTGLAWASWRRLPAAQRRYDLPWLMGLALLGPLVHIAMDFSNNYGVHPFWPLDNRWYYGDAIFIVEPWYWVVALPPLFFAATSRLGKLLLALILVAGLGLAWTVEMVPWGVALALTVGAIAVVAASARLGDVSRIALGVLGSFFITSTFFVTSRLARAAAVDAAVQSHARGGDLLIDVIVTPAVANPVCFGVLVLESVGDRYQVRSASLGLLPAVFPAARCNPPAAATSLPRGEAPGASSEHVQWQSAWSAPLAELVSLNRDNCEAAALFRFTRAPFWFRRGAGMLRIGDVRYDREVEAGFAELDIPARPRACPPAVPPWVPPRAALLR